MGLESSWTSAWGFNMGFRALSSKSTFGAFSEVGIWVLASFSFSFDTPGNLRL